MRKVALRGLFRSGETEWATNLGERARSRGSQDVLQHLGAASFVAVPLKVRGSRSPRGAARRG